MSALATVEGLCNVLIGVNMLEELWFLLAMLLMLGELVGEGDSDDVVASVVTSL